MNHQAPKKTAHEARTLQIPYEIGEFVIIPSQGLSVYSGIETLSVSDMRIETLSFHSTQRPDTKIPVPVDQLKSKGIIPIPDATKLEEIISALGAREKSFKGARQAQNREYKGLEDLGDLNSAITIIHHTLSSYRQADTGSSLITEVPNDLSFTLRAYVNKAVNFIAPIFQVAMGQTKDQARDTIFRAVLEKGFAAKFMATSKLKNINVLSDNEFQELFGITKDQAQDPTVKKSLKNQIKVGPQPDLRAPKDARAIIEEIDQEKAAAILRRTTYATKAANDDGDEPKKRVSELAILQSNKAQYDVSSKHLKKGIKLNILRIAASIFQDPQDLDFVLHAFCLPWKEKLTVNELMIRFKLDENAVVNKSNTLKRLIIENARKVGNTSIANMQFNLKPPKAPQSKTTSRTRDDTPLPSFMKEAYGELSKLMPTTIPTRTIFNVAARKLEDPVDLRIAARTWFVKKEHRYDVKTLCGEFNLSEPELLKKLITIGDTIRAEANARSLKTIDYVPMSIPKDLRPRSV